MTTTAESVVKVVSLNGGELIGRTRLQKSFYFLERQGLGFEFHFQYHHYGPYSDDLTIAAEDASALGLLREEKRIGSRLQSYSVFTAAIEVDEDDRDDERRAMLRTLQRYDAITLELAATADFLAGAGFGDRAWQETAVRKSTKASPERVAKAMALLSEIGR
jgi:uncharacterized protein YwgA